MRSFELIDAVELVDGVMQLTISTAAAGTAMDAGTLRACTNAVRTLGPEVGAILLVGTGPNFCAGGNVQNFSEADDRGAYLYEMANCLHELVRALAASPVPVVAAVHGWAAGAGMSMVCVADIAIGGPSTTMRSAYPRVGLSPDGGITWLLPRIIGASRAREVLLTDAVISAEEAVRLGLLSRTVPDDEIRREAWRVAHGFVDGPRNTYATMRRLLAQSTDVSLSEQLNAERDGIAAAANSKAGREGVDAFVAKRKPNFANVN